jgi:hypothetical protein
VKIKPFRVPSSLHTMGEPLDGHGVWRGPDGSIDPVVAFAKQPEDGPARGYRPQGWRGGASSSGYRASLPPAGVHPLFIRATLVGRTS